MTDGYFALMGIRVVSGRAFGDEDRFGEPALNRREKPDRGVAIVSERLIGASYDEEEASSVPMLNVTAAFASGADDLIEGAANPRLFISRIKVLLGWRQDPQQLAVL